MDLRGRLVSHGETPALESRETQNLHLPVESSYDFPEEVLHQLRSNGHLVTLTRLGLSTHSEDRKPTDQVFPFHLGAIRSERTGIATPPEDALALVFGSPCDPVAVVFASGGVEFACGWTVATTRLSLNGWSQTWSRSLMGHECYRLRLGGGHSAGSNRELRDLR